MKLKLSKPHIPKPHLPKPKLGRKKKKKPKFSKEKKELFASIRKHGVNADTKLVGKAISFVAGIPRIPKTRSERILVERAFKFSEEKHRKQKRLSGHPYFSHAFQTALILSDYGLDSDTIAAALLHDVVEDTDVTERELRKKFGREVAKLVKGVTKLGEYEKEDLELGERLYLRDLLSASSKDVRVLLIKLADKLHNLRTVHFLLKARRKQICENALDIYAPLAERFGLRKMEDEIEDICFKELWPEKHAALLEGVGKRRKLQEKEISELVKALSKIKVGRRRKFFQKFSHRTQARNVYSYYERAEETGKQLDEFYDFVTLVILCDGVEGCYDAVKALHSRFYPIPRKLRDYIAAPRHMTYQSIHTSVIGPRGNPVKVFIRTKEMDELAENGITVWLREKRKQELAEKEAKPFKEISRIPGKKGEFVSALKTDFLEGQISVFTRRGTKAELPKGSTAIDFAFKQVPKKAVKLVQAEINGRQKPVWSTLRNGDRVSLVFSREKTICPDWLDFARTYYAREMIKDELGISRKAGEGRSLLRYGFTAGARKGLLRDIVAALAGSSAELTSFSIERTRPNRFDGMLSISLKRKGAEKEIIERLDRVRGLKEKQG